MIKNVPRTYQINKNISKNAPESMGVWKPEAGRRTTSLTDHL